MEVFIVLVRRGETGSGVEWGRGGQARAEAEQELKPACKFTAWHSFINGAVGAIKVGDREKLLERVEVPEAVAHPSSHEPRSEGPPLPNPLLPRTQHYPHFGPPFVE